MKWIKYDQALPKRWAYKKDIPSQWRHLGLRVEFLFETAWIVRDERNRVLFDWNSTESWVDTFDFHLKTPGHVIGIRDRRTANGSKWAHEWQAAMDDRIHEQLKQSIEHGGPR